MTCISNDSDHNKNKVTNWIVDMLKNSHKVAIHNLESTVSQNFNGSKKIENFVVHMCAGCVKFTI